MNCNSVKPLKLLRVVFIFVFSGSTSKCGINGYFLVLLQIINRYSSLNDLW
jgi:hypothetical protein